ncbi:hypothetical protein [Pontibacter populi]|uniref:STAS/SEC14 domain-containing protein n=1 Tax=Pontibacter populi TaxID=890055 RepID=A0ABV1RYR8_9BACT
MHTLILETVLQNDYVTIRYSSEDKLIWNEWRGTIPTADLKEAMLFACNFIVANNIALILADYTHLSPPTREDQVWIAKTTSKILQHSNLRRVANINGHDLFQQLAIDTIHQIAAQTPMPCETRDFLSKAEAKEWLFSVNS